MSAVAQRSFERLLENAKTRSEKTMQKWEKKKNSLDSNFDNFYEQDCLKVHPGLPEQALVVLRMLHSKAKDSIDAMFGACSTSHHEDVKYFGDGLSKTKFDVMNAHEQELRLSKEETSAARMALKNFQNKVQTRVNDQSDMMPGVTQIRRDSPGSGGMSFEVAHSRSRKRSPHPRSRVLSRSRSRKAATKRQNQKMEPTIDPVTRNIASRSHTRGPSRNILAEESAHISPEALPPVRDLSTSRKSRSPESNQSHYEAFQDEKFDDIHPMMKVSIEAASELNQQYEDNMVMVNDADPSDLENMDDEEDELQDDEDYVPRRRVDELAAKNRRLVDENTGLHRANADLHEENNRFQEMINGLTNANEELKRENGELSSRSPHRGLPADETSRTEVRTWDSAGPDLDTLLSPGEIEQRGVPAIPDTPPTAGKVKSPLSMPPSPSPHHNVSTDTPKPTSPVSPGSSDAVSSNGSIQCTPTKTSAPISESLHRYNTSDMGSSQYPDTMSDILARLRTAVARCNSDIQKCQREMKTSLGHEISSKLLLEYWQNATKKHRRDLRETVMYFESVKDKLPPSKDKSRAGSSSFGGSTFRSFGSSPSSSNMGNSLESDFVGDSQWDVPERVSPEFGNAPEPPGSKEKPHEPERVQESSPMEGTPNKKNSTRESSSSSSEDDSKTSQSEPKPQTQPQDSQDSQESSGPRARTGTKAPTPFQHWLTIFFYCGLPFIQKRGMNPSLAVIIPVLAFYYHCFDRWMDRHVRSRLPSYIFLFNAVIAIILTIGFLYLYATTYDVYLVLLRERDMWLEANRMAPTLMLKRAAMSSRASVWGLSEEQGLKRGVRSFVEFMCWSLGITTLKNWILDNFVVAYEHLKDVSFVVEVLLRTSILRVKAALFGGA